VGEEEEKASSERDHAVRHGSLRQSDGREQSTQPGETAPGPARGSLVLHTDPGHSEKGVQSDRLDAPDGRVYLKKEVAVVH
jgi:hypothetical protein